MALVTKPPVLDESVNTTESPSRNIADVLAQELSGIASAITGGSDKVPKTDIAMVEPSNTASRAYSVGELVYVNGNLYKVITAISIGSTFTVGTNIQSTNVGSALKQGIVTLLKNETISAVGDVTIPNYSDYKALFIIIKGDNNNGNSWYIPGGLPERIPLYVSSKDSSTANDGAPYSMAFHGSYFNGTITCQWEQHAGWLGIQISVYGVA